MGNDSTCGQHGGSRQYRRRQGREYFERLNIVTSGTNGSPITWIGETGAMIDGSRPAPTVVSQRPGHGCV